MIKTTIRNRQAVSRIVSEYRILAGTSEKPASLRTFAENITEALAPRAAISYQSIKNWQDQTYLPDAYMMLHLSQAARFDWRGDFATDILAAILPDRYSPASEIGRRVLGLSGFKLEGVHNGNGNGHTATK